MPDEPAIFISYRSRDAGGHGRALHEYLSGRFGDERVFFDRNTIESGNVFPDKLRQGVEGCAVLLALIGPEWLDVRGEDGGRRLGDADDFVRREIALALEQGKKVIPVLFDDAPVPPRDRLPDQLKALASCDALTLRGKTYDYQTQRRELVRLLAKVPGVPEPLPEAGEAIAAIPAGLSALVGAATGPPQQLSQEQRETIHVLERQLGASETQLRTFFQIIGKAQVPPEQQPARLTEIAAQYRQLRAQVAALPGDAPEVARLKDAARAALDAGRLQQVDDLLVQVEVEQDAVLDRQVDSPAAMQLANLLAFFAPGAIIPDLIFKHTKFLPEPLKSTVQDRTAFDDAVNVLARSSFVHGDARALSLHPFVQTLIRDRMDEKSRRQFVENAVALLDAALPDFPYGEWDAEVAALHDSLDQHALAAATHAETTGVALESAARLFAKVGMNNWMRGKFADAKAAFQRTLAIDEKTVGSEHPWVATDVNNLGMVLKDQGDLPGARACFERARAIDEKVFGANHPNVSTRVNNLGKVLWAQGDLAGARACFEQALAIAEEASGPDHPAVANSVSNLGSVLQNLGDLAGARACFERALAIAEKVFGPDHPAVANSVSNLGSVLQNLGDLAGARACFERALAIAEKVFGPDHPLLADLLRNLARALWQAGDIHSGLAAINRSILLYRARADRYHLAECEHLRGKMLEELHDISATEESYISALGNYEAAGDHFGTSSVLADTAAFYLRQGRFADAATAITKSLQVLHDTHSRIPQTHVDLAGRIGNVIGVAAFDKILHENVDKITRDLIRSQLAL